MYPRYYHSLRGVSLSLSLLQYSCGGFLKSALEHDVGYLGIFIEGVEVYLTFDALHDTSIAVLPDGALAFVLERRCGLKLVCAIAGYPQDVVVERTLQQVVVESLVCVDDRSCAPLCKHHAREFVEAVAYLFAGLSALFFYIYYRYEVLCR